MKHIKNFWIDEISTDKSNRQECSGCSACEQICGHSAIRMKRDKEEFLYPEVDIDKCVNCGLCVKVCPIINKCETTKPYIKTFAGYSTNNEIINRTTSGGFVTALSQHIIRQGGIVFGVKFNKNLTHTEYEVAKALEDLLPLAGSKYIQADKKSIFRQVRDELLKNNSPILFIGCPCDVAALQRFLIKEYDNLLTCELVCMGVTSPKVAKDYKEWTERKNHSKLVNMNMRSKKKGWFVPHLEEVFANGKTKCETLFGTYIGYGFQVFNRPSCFFCQYRDTTGAADIRVGDFWGIKDIDEFWNPNGVSAIYVRTQRGLGLVKELSENDFRVFETDYILATRSNMSSYMNKPPQYRTLRDKFAEIYIDQNRGLVAACKSTASLSFWVKHYIPDVFHSSIKKLYHLIKDQKRK